jgi:hypothetical protein
MTFEGILSTSPYPMIMTNKNMSTVALGKMRTRSLGGGDRKSLQTKVWGKSPCFLKKSFSSQFDNC